MNDPQDRNQKGGWSRRQFLHGTGLTAAAGALGGVAVPGVAEAGANGQGAQVPQMGPNPVKITLTVNGQRMNTSVEPRVTLLDALRDYLDVTGCKKVCDRATCGACTVMLDGKVVYSCTTLAVEAQEREVRTAESLAGNGQLDAVPAAFARSSGGPAWCWRCCWRWQCPWRGRPGPARSVTGDRRG